MAIRRAKQNDITNCPECGVYLNYETGQRPDSAEADHIVPYSAGGEDHINNVRIICRRCNQSLGGKTGKRKPKPPPIENIDFT